MIKLVGILLFSVPFYAQAMIPIEGIIMGDARTDFQHDPLSYIYSDIYDKGQLGENKKIKLYQNTYASGIELYESCGQYSAPTYSTSWKEKQALRSTVATLQYIGLDTSIKAIGAYGVKLGLSEKQFTKLSKNLVANYCSQNITIFSLRNIEKTLLHYYKNHQDYIIPSVSKSPFATIPFVTATESEQARSNEFDYAIKNFRAFCSWGGDVGDYRMLAPYLNNRFIMAFVLKNMTGIQDVINDRTLKVETRSSTSTVQVLCRDLICRKTGISDIKNQFPLSVGSTGLATDLSKLYCHHFRFQDYLPKQTLPEVKEWINKAEIEEPILESGFFISLMTGMPELMLGVESYKDIPFIVKSSIDERWNKWANETLSYFSKDLLFEESLKVKTRPQERSFIKEKRFQLDFTVTLGELDRLLNDTDKIESTFYLKLTKNYLRELRTKWNELSQEVDLEGQKNFKMHMANYIELQLKKKEKYFLQEMWNKDFAKLIADELLKQAIAQRSSYFSSYKEEVIEIPVNFRYGIFALSYLKYRSDVKGGRLKINL